MTVRELRELLMKYDDDAIVVEECKGEHIVLEPSDVKMMIQIFNCESGEVEDGKFLVLECWS